VVNVGGVVVTEDPSQSPVNAVSVLYTIPVVRNHASISNPVAIHVALLFLRPLLVSLNVNVGLVLSTIKFAVSAVVFNPALSYTVILNLITPVFALIPTLGVVHT
jgi:hypothetical protein